MAHREVTRAPIEYFDALSRLPDVRHAFICRVPGLEVDGEKSEVLRRLDASHRRACQETGFSAQRLITARQIHGSHAAVVDGSSPAQVPGADALVTNSPEVCLGIYVADCCAIYLVDPVRRCIGLAHSGHKGTMLGILPATIAALERAFGTDAPDLIVQLSPCIRPPHYEEDFAAAIVRQARDCGVRQVFDCGISTARNLDRYYSYRMEKGRTGRMLALLALS